MFQRTLGLVTLLGLASCTAHDAEELSAANPEQTAHDSVQPQEPGTTEPAPRKVEACWVETAHADVPLFGAVTASGILVRHEAGDILIDAGASTNYDEEIEPYSGADRAFYETIPALMKPKEPLSAVLTKMNVKPDGIRSFIPTHVHIDHVGGMMDMPDLPVLVSDADAALVREATTKVIFEVVPAHAKRLTPLLKPLVFQAKPHEGFATSADLLGDGSIVIVPLPGHTPGSVGVFVKLANGKRIFHVGDTIGTREQLETGEGKSWPMDRTDSDPAATLERVRELQALKRRLPDLHILPAHDRAAWTAVFQGPATCIR